MFPLLASMMLTAVAPAGATDGNSVPTFDPKALATCMAFVAQGSTFNGLSDQDTPGNASYLDQTIGICSHEILPLWSEVHARARAELGLPEVSSQPMTVDEARRSLGEMDQAERQMRMMIAEHWIEASPLRHQPLDIPPRVMADYMQNWLTDNPHIEEVTKSADEPMKCVGATIHSKEDIRVLQSAKPSQNFDQITHRCKFDDAVKMVSEALQERFPTADPALARGVADSFLRQLVFWSLTGQH